MLLRFIYSNAYIAVPITAITFETYMLIDDFNFNHMYLAFLFFSTLFLYPFHRLYGVFNTLPYEHTKAQKEVKKKPIILYSSIAIGFIGTIIFGIQLPMETLQLLLPLSLISITYSVPIIPTINGWKRLRDIPGVKIYAITLVVTLTTSTIPLIITTSIGTLDIFLLGIQRFFLILAITIPFDIRDQHLDKRWDLKTIPLIIGKERALKLSIGLLYLSTATAIIQLLTTHLFNIEIVIAVILAQILSTSIIKGFDKNNSYLYNAVLIEGIMIYHAAIITIAVVIASLI